MDRFVNVAPEDCQNAAAMDPTVQAGDGSTSEDFARRLETQQALRLNYNGRRTWRYHHQSWHHRLLGFWIQMFSYRRMK